MICAGKKLREMDQRIIQIRCTAHVLNLLTNDIIVIPSFARTIKKANDILKTINQSKVKKGIFNQKQRELYRENSSTLKSATSTRC